MTKDMERWVESQHPNIAKGLSEPVEGGPFLHMSTLRDIRCFIPRLPRSVKDKEDMTTPRVCGALDLDGCIVGIPHVLVDTTPFLYVYSLGEGEFAKPKKSISGVKVTDGEVWLVPHRLSNWEVKGEIIGYLRLEHVEYKGDDDDKVPTYCVYAANFKQPIKCGGVVAEPGYYNVYIKNGKLDRIAHIPDGELMYDRAGYNYEVTLV